MTRQEDALEGYKQIEKEAWEVVTSSNVPLQKKAEALEYAIAARIRIDKIEMQNER